MPTGIGYVGRLLINDEENDRVDDMVMGVVERDWCEERVGEDEGDVR